jgi:hypothetical protein
VNSNIILPFATPFASRRFCVFYRCHCIFYSISSAISKSPS